MKRPAADTAVALVALLCATSARAQTAGVEKDPSPTARDSASPSPRARKLEPFGPRNAVSIYPWSLLGPGVALQYERYAFPRWVSVVTGAGFRMSGEKDYGSFSFSTALEGRLWFVGSAPFTTVGERAMVGPYFAARADVTWTRLWRDRDSKVIGTTLEHEETLLFGHRFVAGPVEVTPLLGGGITTQIDPSGRLATASRWVLKAGLTLGILF